MSTPNIAGTAAAITASSRDDDCDSTDSTLTEDDDCGPGWPPFAPLAVILATFATAIYILVDKGGKMDPISPN